VIIRAFWVFLSFAALLLASALYVQDLPFDPSDALWALFFALPLGLAALRGDIGRERFEYPGAPFIVLGSWIATMAPSFIVDHPAAHWMFFYSDEAIEIGRILFFIWCVVFVLASGSANRERSALQPHGIDVFAIALPIALAVTYQLTHGAFSNYQVGSDGDAIVIDGGGPMSVASSLGGCTLIALPCFFEVVFVRTNSRRLRLIAGFGFGVAWIMLLLSGSRAPLAYSVALCFYAARVLGVRFRTSFNVAVLIALPLVLFLVFNYRNALRTSGNPLASVSDFASVAVDSTQSIVSERGARQDAIVNWSDNIKLRLWAGPQFFAVVDEWLDHGASMQGTFWEGVIRSLPSWVIENKNQIANTHKLEEALVRTGRFPDVDLGPMPWLQWLFELGWFGLLLGAVVYGRLVRLIDRRISRTGSLYELLFWVVLLSQICSPEHTTDALVIFARNVSSTLLVAFAIRFAVQRLLLPPRAARPGPRVDVA
jgi:hypothetical protein